jgi:hypothetical protein
VNRQPTPDPVEPPPDDTTESPVDVVRAVILGIRDTWSSMLTEGRRAARATYDRRWRDFDAKTKGRRSRPR